MSFASDFTGGLFDPQGPAYGKLATKNEKQRQALINQGLGQLNSIFGGGTADFYSMANAGGKGFKADRTTRDQPYYHLTGKGFTPYMNDTQKPDSFLGDHHDWQMASVPTGGVAGGIEHGGNGDWGQSFASILTGGLFDTLGSFFGGNEESPLDKAKKAYDRGQLLNKTTATYEGFQPSFYDQRAKDYLSFALPEEARQYRTNLDAVTYNLANRGLLKSSQATNQYSNLNRTDMQAKQSIADSALDQANALRQKVEEAKSGAISQLYQTGDANLAASNAIHTMSSIAQPNAFAPISNLFGNLATNVYVNNLLNSYKGGGASNSGPSYYDLSGALPHQ